MRPPGIVIASVHVYLCVCVRQPRACLRKTLGGIPSVKVIDRFPGIR